MQNEIAIPLRYEVYLQDLSTEYINLEYLGYTNTIEEAKALCKMFKEALQRNHYVDGKDLSNCTVLFRPILKENN